ncbi:hypothetical protein V1264_020657 [Littorina saxatilis]|uniref:Centrosomal protein of 83 kDa n=1 Tax=Littorina saxatilis TaxID=31220 RepID=A0AAN9BC95_9CAEN
MVSVGMMGGAGGIPAMASSLPLGSSMPRLVQETELQKLLTDERMRSEQHKTNYQQLKIEHSRLQEEYLALQEEIKVTIEESKVVQEKYRSMYETCRRELAERQAQLQELHAKALTPQKVEVIRSQVHSEVESVYREKYFKQEEEAKEAWANVSKLRYELSFLKAEYEHDKAEHARQMQDLKLHNDLEVTNLRRERDVVLSKVTAESSNDAGRVRVLQRDNATLHVRIKGLLAELEELRSEKEKQGLEADSIHRTHEKQINELQSTLRSLEVERESLKRQSELFQREISTHGADHSKLRGRIHELERELAISKGQNEESNHRAMVQLSDLKLEMTRSRGELEKDRDKLANMVEDLRTQVEIAEHKVKQLQTALEDKEREATQRVTAAREEEFGKIAKAENEKFELETRLQETERRKIDDDARRHAEQEKHEEKVQQARAEKEQAEREAITLRARLQSYESLQDTLERERSDNSELKSKVQQLEADLSSAISQEQDLTDQMIKVRNEAELARQELHLTRQQLGRLENNHDLILAQQRAALQEDRQQAEARVAELESQLAAMHDKYSHAASVHKKLKKKYSRVTEHLKDKIILLKATNKELDIEKQALQQFVPPDQFARLKKQWKELFRRHQEFRNIILGRLPQGVIIGERTFSKMDPSINLDATIPNVTLLEQEMEKQHQDDLKLLRERLDNLDNLQSAQLEELTSIAHSTLIGSQESQPTNAEEEEYLPNYLSPKNSNVLHYEQETDSTV